MILDPQMVARVQTFLGVPADRDFGPATLAAAESYMRQSAFRMAREYPQTVAPMVAMAGAPSDIARRLVELALKEVGVHEQGGENCGPRIRDYQGSTNLSPGSWPWCAAFQCWLINQALLKGPLVNFKRPVTAGAWDFEQWAREQGEARGVRLIKPKSEPARAGDIVVFTFSHIGLCAGPEVEGRVPTIEGNTNADGGREGDGVYRKSRKPSAIRSLIRLS